MSSFIQAILGYLLKTFLDWSLKTATAAYEDAAAKKKLDEERKVTDAANEAAYDAAKDRKERLEAAESLLNGEA